jgi:hypothetical protein
MLRGKRPRPEPEPPSPDGMPLPSALPPVNGSMVLRFIDEILPGISRFYLCRHKTCGLITHSSSWVKAKENDYYRCPKCTERYWPWKDTPGNMPAQTAVVIEHEGESTITLCTLPDTATKNLEDLLKIDENDLREEVRGKDLDYIMEYVKGLNRSSIPTCFEPMTLSDEARDTFAMLSVSQSEGRSKNTWPVDHLDEGFFGVCFQWDDANPPRVMEFILRSLSRARRGTERYPAESWTPLSQQHAPYILLSHARCTS